MEMDSDDETILSKMDEHRIGEIGTLDQSGLSTDVPLLDTSVKQEVQSDDEFRRGFKNTVIPKIYCKLFKKKFYKPNQAKFNLIILLAERISTKVQFYLMLMTMTY